MSSSAKRKGTRVENEIKKMLQHQGIECRRQPLSGALSDFPHDLRAVVKGYGPLIIECKARKEGHKTLDRWLGKAEALVIKGNYQDPCVYMTWKTFTDLLITIQDLDQEAQTFSIDKIISDATD